MNQEYNKISERLKSANAGPNLYKEIVDAPFDMLVAHKFDIATIVLLVDNKDSGYIDRVALSNTAAAEGAVKASALPFNEIRIPRDYKDSAHVRALKNKKAEILTDWYDMFRPALTADQARDNQHSSGVLTSVVQPFYGSKLRGTIIFSFYVEADNISNDAFEFINWYSDLISEIY